ncbi:MAG: pentapeptide repeat-containing protein [Chloroflexi bacterium]|nr:pentapeptide repeat-containing protein [Chloroflexota bacterium]
MTADATTCSYTRVYLAYPQYRCPLPVEAGQPVCILHDTNPAKDQAAFLTSLRSKIRQDSADPGATNIRLDGTVFPGDFRWDVAIAGVDSTKGVSFPEATFSGRALFSGVTFTGDAYFVGVTFTGDAYFVGVTFTGDATFSFATFSGNAGFARATFSGDAYFVGATFTGDASFIGATFSGNANFSQAKFTDDANFHWATFRQRLVFSSLNSRNQERDTALTEAAPGDAAGMNRAFTLHFHSVILEQPHLVSFEDVDLSKASFLYTNLSQVRFIAVTWARKKKRLWRFPLVKTNQYVIGDHLELEGKWETLAPGERQQQAALVADVYRQLRLNLEGTRQEVEAGHFYIGQMDMRLRDPQFSWPQRALLHVYRALAMYGESAWRPLFLYLLISIGFAFLYLWCGFAWNDAAVPVQYGPFWSDGLTFPISDYGKAWFIAATAGTPLRANIQFIGSWGYVVLFLNMVLGIFFIALFVIALRRHYRR